MEKFSSFIQKTAGQDTTDILFQEGPYKVRKADGWIYMDEPDMIIAMLYIADEGQLIFRYEYIPTYKARDTKEHYLTMLSGSVEKDEKPIDCLFREVEEETGMRIRPNVDAKLINTLFVSKGCRAKYHIYFLEVYSSDYEQVEIKGDGSASEDASQSIRIPVSQLPQLQTEDTITSYCVEFLKNYFQL